LQVCATSSEQVDTLDRAGTRRSKWSLVVRYKTVSYAVLGKLDV
jgi:hypothetical protein